MAIKHTNAKYAQSKRMTEIEPTVKQFVGDADWVNILDLNRFVLSNAPNTTVENSAWTVRCVRRIMHNLGYEEAEYREVTVAGYTYPSPHVWAKREVSL